MKTMAACLMVLLAACAKTGNDSVLHNDSLAVVPIGPGTDTSVIRSPDTPGSPPDSAAADTTRRQRPHR